MASPISSRGSQRASRDFLKTCNVMPSTSISTPTGTGRIVELARALATRPKVLLLDEPAAGQDTEETERFSEVLRDLANDGLAILLVEHDMELVMNVCHTVVVLDYGRTIFTGTPAEVRADPEVQAAYLGTVSTAVGDA